MEVELKEVHNDSYKVSNAEECRGLVAAQEDDVDSSITAEMCTGPNYSRLSLYIHRVQSVNEERTQNINEANLSYVDRLAFFRSLS